jgi:hypothetical protein
MTLNRRNFLATVGASAALGAMPIRSSARPRVAFLGTVVKKLSHAQHFLDRHTLGYTWNGGWQDPRIEIASVYIDQFPEDDLAKNRIARHKLKQFPTIAEALTLGGEKLAVDGVIIIGEHGDYPENEKGQKRYPRYDWFKQVVKVFEDSGRSVPVFNDKHLSTSWDECAEMVADSKRLDFPFLAGSSLPVTRRLPSIDMPLNTPLKESVCVAYGRIDSYDVHALETAQCMSERRRGGEVGIRQVHALRDEKLWARLNEPDCENTRKLIVAALTRSHTLPAEDGFPTDRVSFEWARQTFPEAIGYLIEHLDGFRTTMVLTDIHDFNYAGMLDSGKLISCQMYLPMPEHGATTADFFNPLAHHIETTMIEKKTPYPIERTLLTSGMVIAGVESLHAGEVPYATPQMKVAYTASKESSFWQS